jgi:hypothetical protein
MLRITRHWAYLVILLTGTLIGQLGLLSSKQVSSTLSTPASTVRPRSIAPGDTLPGVPLIPTRHSEFARASAVTTTLRAITGGRCSIVVFFSTTCPFSRAMAPAWAGIDTLRLSGAVLTVHWLSVASDTEASDFLRRHDLPAESFAVRNTADLAQLGVSGWPTLYLIDGTARFRARLPQTPDAIRLTVRNDIARACVTGNSTTSLASQSRPGS